MNINCKQKIVTKNQTVKYYDFGFTVVIYEGGLSLLSVIPYSVPLCCDYGSKQVTKVGCTGQSIVYDLVAHAHINRQQAVPGTPVLHPASMAIAQ